jgi:hypothetical protein
MTGLLQNAELGLLIEAKAAFRLILPQSSCERAGTTLRGGVVLREECDKIKRFGS